MAGITESRTWDALLTTTLANYKNVLYDNIFDFYPLLSWLNGKLGQGLRGNSVKRVVNGGESIVEQLLYAKNSTAKRYSGYEVMDMTPQEGMTIARYNWKQHAVTITISGLERRSNMGEQQLITLLQAKANQAEMSLRDLLSTDAWSDGTADGGKQLTGLQALISATATVGGLNPSTYTWWASPTTTSGSFTAQGLADMRTTYNDASYGNDKPDAVFTTQAVYEFYENALQPQERYTDHTTANSGFTFLTFKGIPVLWDRDCPSGKMYFLNSKYINFVVHKDADMEVTPFVTPDNQDASSAKILFQGNLTVSNRRMHSVMSGITA